VLRASAELRRKVLAFAGELLEANPTDLELADDRVGVRGSPRQLDLAEIARAVHYNTGAVAGAGEPSLEATAYFVSPGAGTFAAGAHLAAVDVDPESWRVRLERYVAVDDCGRVINPAIVEGQIRGGVVQGIGQALLEQLVYDRDGQLLNASLMEYLLPTAAELCEVEVHHLDTPSTVGEGFRGVGESGACGAPGAIANAVADALAPLGLEVSSLPITPELLFSLAEPGAPQP
jgi:carbon-monoxide dehydrogenase large subunit